MADVVITPKFRVPFQIYQGSVQLVEQDSDEEIQQCLVAILKTPLGSRADNPELGIPDFAFRQGGADLAMIRAALLRFEPRATFELDEELTNLFEQIELTAERGTSG